MSFQLLKSQKGVLTTDFLFAFVLVMGFSALMFALSITLTMVEVTQYITFAAARSYSASHVNEDFQRQLATAKYMELRNNGVFAPLYTNGWFEIALEDVVIGDHTLRFPQYGNQGTGRGHLFYGAGTNFNARVLDFEIPLYGSTTSVDSQGEGFQTFIASYLGREPTINECLNFNNLRWQSIKQLPGAGSTYGRTPSRDQDYVPMADNGC